MTGRSSCRSVSETGGRIEGLGVSVYAGRGGSSEEAVTFDILRVEKCNRGSCAINAAPQSGWSECCGKRLERPGSGAKGKSLDAKLNAGERRDGCGVQGLKK